MALEKIFQALIAIVVLAVVLGIFFMGPDALFGKAKNATPNISKYIQIGSEEVSAKPVPPKIEKAYKDIVNAFKSGSESPIKENCLIYFDALDAKEDFNKGYYIQMDEAPDGTWFLLYNKDNVIMKKEKIANIKPCYFGGKLNNVIPAKTFYDYLTGKQASQLLPLTSNSMLIKNNVDLYVDKKYDLDDNDLEWDGKKIDLLFKINDHLICFIPTNDVFGANENGINDNEFKKMLPGGEYNKFDFNSDISKIPFCSNEQTYCKVIKKCEDISNNKLFIKPIVPFEKDPNAFEKKCMNNICNLNCEFDPINNKCVVLPSPSSTLR